MHPPTRQAFTLVELLVVIAVIGVLMSIVVPGVMSVVNRALQTKCASQLQQWGVAEDIYNTQFGFLSASRSFPTNLNVSRPANVAVGSPASNPNAQSWVHPLLPYIERNELYNQIENLPPGGSLASLNLSAQGIKLLQCPADISDSGVANPSRTSYAVNGGRVNGPPSGPNPLDWQASGVFDDRLKGTADTFQIFKTSKADIANWDGTSNTLMILENSDLMGWTRADNEYDVAVVWGPTIPTHPLNKSRKPAGAAMSLAHARPISYHTSGFNVVFCDGSTRFLSDAIDYSVYSQLMTSNTAQLREPSSTNPTPSGPYMNPLNGNSF